MKILIDIDDNVYTRLFNNGTELSAYDLLILAKCVRKGTPQQEPCEDAISRQAVLAEIDKYISKSQSTGTKDDFFILLPN